MKCKPRTVTPFLRHCSLNTLLLAVSLFLLGSLGAIAQETGTVTGQVADKTTGKYLEGAEVAVGTLRTATERDGRFILRNVPAGAQTVTVSYPGLEQSEQSVEVPTGRSVDVEVSLGTEEIVTLGEFRVEGTKEGMAQAVALQKVAVQAKLVAAGDQFGSVSEGNIGEYLKYLPGVGVDYNSNDARGISLRGLRTQFTIVAIDGTPMASAASGGTNRRFETEQVSMNNVETSEVYKTVTPDVPADATGGFINMVTKSAFDRQDLSRFSYDVSFIVPHTRLGDALSKKDGTWGRDSQYVTRPNLDLNYARRVSDKLGFNLSYRFSERYDDSPRTEYTWATTVRTGQLASGAAPSLTDPALQTYNHNNEQKLTHRESFAAKVDYNISSTTKLVFSGQWNWYDLTFAQRATTFNLGTTGINNLPGIDDNATANSGRSIVNNINQRNKYGTTVHVNSVFSHEINENSKAWVTGYWSQANSLYRDHTRGYVGQASAALSGNPAYQLQDLLANPELPGLTGVARETLYDLGNYTLSGGGNTRLRPQKAQDTKGGARADYKYSFDFSMPLVIQAGAAYDQVGRSITVQQFNLPASLLSSANNAAGLYSADYTFDYGFGFGTGEVLDLYKVYEAFGARMIDQNPSTWNEQRFDERNSAFYTRADFTPFRSLFLVGGLRYEKHTLDGRGYGVLTAGARNIPYHRAYDKIYPSISARYTPLRSVVARAAFSRTVGHPDYSDVLPTIVIPDSGTASLTFPTENLNPYYVTNYDAGLEYYFAKSGMAGVSVFRKEVGGFITSLPLDPNNAELRARFNVPDATTIGTASMRVNGGDSVIQGIELLYNQTLAFLPKPFNGLNVQFNWTKIDIDADDLATQYGMETNAATQTFNFVVSYRLGKLSMSVSNNWVDDTLIGVGTSSALLNSWKAPDWKTNISVRYELSRRYIVYTEISNLFSKREEYYKGTATSGSSEAVMLPFRRFEYGYPHVAVGVRGTF